MAPTTEAPIAAHGYFGEPTATIDWCEENYKVTPYVAEFWNTISNVFIVVPPILGIVDICRQKVEHRFVIAYLTVLVVGVGSMLFHSTLLYEMQLMDEVPMVYGACVIGYCLTQIHGPMGKPNWRVCAVFALYSLVFTVVYLTLKWPIIHEVMFLLLTFSLIYLALRLIIKTDSPSSRRLFVAGIIMYAVSGVAWNLDNLICPRLQSLRETRPFAVGSLTQLHAWWHVFSGYGTYVLIVSIIGYRLNYLEKQFEVHWFYLVPSLRVTTQSGNADATNNNDDDAHHELIVVDAKKTL